MKRRCMSALLTLTLLAGLFSAACLAVSAESYTTAATMFSDAEIAARLATAESVWPDGGVYTDAWDDGCETCYGFIRELFRYVFGAALPTIWSTADARFINNDGVVTEAAHADWYGLEQLRGILASARPGDVLIATTGYGSHAVIVRSAVPDGSGVYVYDANWNKNSAGQPLIRTNAWWSAEDMQRARPGAVTLYRLTGQGAGMAGYAGGYYTDTTSPGIILNGGSSAGIILNGGNSAGIVLPGGSPAPGGGTAAAPAAPAALSAPAVVRAEKRVYGTAEGMTFNWDAARGATGYYVTLTKDGTPLYSFDVGANLSFTSTPLRAGGNYVLTVYSVSGGLHSATGAEYPFTVTDAAPAAVVTLATDKSGYTAQETVSVRWDGAYGAESYYLYLVRDDGKVFYAWTQNTAITLSPLPQAAYTLMVRAVNHAGYTDGVPSVRITVGAAQ